jgi:hypothetical protein
VQKVTVTIEGINWQDMQELELPAIPRVGEALETRYGTCLVTRVDPSTDGDQPARIVCRFPGES